MKSNLLNRYYAFRALYLNTEALEELLRALSLVAATALIVFLATLSSYHAMAQKTVVKDHERRISITETHVEALARIDARNEIAITELRATAMENAKNISMIKGIGTGLVSILVVMQILQMVARRKNDGRFGPS